MVLMLSIDLVLGCRPAVPLERFVTGTNTQTHDGTTGRAQSGSREDIYFRNIPPGLARINNNRNSARKQRAGTGR